jgi:hypothetical protein
MVFSTVQISIPGTSCERVSVDISMQQVKSPQATKAIRPVIEIPINPIH